MRVLFVIERCVWDLRSTSRSLVAYAEWVHNTTFEPGSVILAWVVEFLGLVVSKCQRSFSDVKSAYERWKQKSYRKAQVPIGELVMFIPMEKPKDKGEIRNRVGITLSEWSKLALFIACRQGSEVMPGTRRASEACRGNRIQPRRLRASRRAWLVLSVFHGPDRT